MPISVKQMDPYCVWIFGKILAVQNVSSTAFDGNNGKLVALNTKF